MVKTVAALVVLGVGLVVGACARSEPGFKERPGGFRAARGLAERGITVVVVTHNPELAARTKRVIRLRDGLIAGS